MRQEDVVKLVITEINRFAKDNIVERSGTVGRRWMSGDGTSYQDPAFKIKVVETSITKLDQAIWIVRTYFNSKVTPVTVIGPYRTDINSAWKYKGQYFVDMDNGISYHIWSPSKFKNPKHKLVLTA